MTDPIALEDQYGAHNYHPLPVTIATAEGAWVTGTDGRRYLDCLAGYSALNFGHRHPALIAAATEQLGRVTLTSRAFHHDQLGPFVAELAALAGKDAVLPMNSGAEAVETALKLARRWGYLVKGVADGEATIIVADGNFHGRTISIISFSGDAEAHDNYGPYTPGFRSVPYGDAAALAAAIDDTTVAVLIEPVQGEAGVVVPPEGYLAAVRATCTERNVLMIADEIQSGLGRAGATFASGRAGVVPDAYILGKALGGGIMPLSAVVTDRAIMDVITPGTHGSTFGGNPLAAAVGRAVVKLLEPGDLQAAALAFEPELRDRLEPLRNHGVDGLRIHGLWVGLDLDPALGTGRALCEKLADNGVLAKDTHGSTIRLSPPLIVTPDDLDHLTDRLTRALKSLAR
ncbi:ornithine--oxo-acid transaminase [Kribbella sandramycini]|uniref:ornithine aminotransferase n=1 Tax=Kribbella sandramycini TaxID=60450 RepID=A0A7Y4NZT2_9ACTN|nr:ornithine--oxo-acid transaminase [Kribbella sandramycini]MBB6569851.1 ornithine--oxo-acid transaminase [Kribbella sandramycini]NOL40324.1 ornithine--oxo-acid transaminase [Kribbella sandramycini]